ncbi:YcdB/YcdC domain-containing protein [Brevibacillus borstelensis]|uniref:YcdB/YcdC domain-containing protein n=1 Tax=Brevibacillus borstelensis TaxID=45462 RepID=UPI0030C4DFCA
MRKLNQAMMTIAAASLLTAAPLWADGTAAVFASSQTTSDAALNDVIKKSLDQLSSLLPYMKELPVQTVKLTEDSSTVVITRTPEKAKLPEMTIFLKKTGEIESFSLENDVDDKDKKLSLEDQKKKAEAFLTAAHQKGLVECSLEELQYNETASKSLKGAMFTRVINGLPVEQKKVSVYLDAAGNVVDFSNEASLNGKSDPSKFPSPSEALSPEQAKQALTKMMKPFYRLVGPDKTPTLVYQVAGSGYMDAKTGSWVDTEHAKFKSFTGEFFFDVPVAPSKQPLTARSKEEAAAILQKVLGFDLTGAAFSEQNTSVLGKSYKEYRWTKDKESYLVTVDPTSGQVSSAGLDTDEDAVQPPASSKISLEDAKKAAVQLVQPFLDSDTKTVVLETRMYNEPQGHYNFQVYPATNGIPFAEKSYHVSINSETGKPIRLVGPSVDDKVALPDPKNAISAEQAMQEYLKHHPLQLTYFYPVKNSKKADQPVLVYKAQINPDVPEYVDAMTGKIVSR